MDKILGKIQGGSTGTPKYRKIFAFKAQFYLPGMYVLGGSCPTQAKSEMACLGEQGYAYCYYIAQDCVWQYKKYPRILMCNFTPFCLFFEVDMREKYFHMIKIQNNSWDNQTRLYSTSVVTQNMVEKVLKRRFFRHFYSKKFLKEGSL